ncbi:type VI secretion system protein VasJ [Pseudomonas nitritireducens]|uniref:Type VI secretion system protein VasJ n=1 Tax=Pseudomonas nitroreducens TaxID=46680 RepID=A0A7W7P3E7_PSENT|nr:type VI secretion system protein TssA [Pseudomonas nitritireducens]MBB4866918.1 type VI secretion system protein VasJ [Pseudomonas nitritireducens]
MSHSRKLAAHFVELAAAPITSGDYAGEDVRYSPEYESLQAELARASSLHGNGLVDWQKILDVSEQILRTQSKDLRVAAWMTWALQQRESFAGLQAGIAMLLKLCQEHWNEVHPRKDRTRAAAIAWLVPRLEPLFAENLAIKDQLPLFRQLAGNLRALDECLTERLSGDAPLMLPLCRRLDEMLQRASQGQPEPGSVGAVVAQVKQAASNLLAPVSVIDNEKDAHKALRTQQDNARPLCNWWLRQKATDLRALRLNRTLLWLPIDSLPERNAEQTTALRSLPADKLRSYSERFEQGQYADLLVDLETSLARAPFWFDGQRLAWECLQALRADLAMREVEIQFALFLQRLPGVIDLKFFDGNPFADPSTRDWISAHVLPHIQTPATPREITTSSDSAPWELALEESLSMLRHEGLKSAVQFLKQGLQNSQGGRERFFWQLSMARLCLQAKKYELARTQLESLDEQLQASALHLWEPDLALQVLHLLHTCCELLPQSNSVRERKDEVYRRLCHLDLEVVLD